MSQLLSLRRTAQGKPLDGPEQWLELDVMGVTSSYQLSKCRKSPTNNGLCSEMAKAH